MRSFAVGLLASLVSTWAISSAGAVTVSGTYYEDDQEKSCSGTNACVLQFALPAAISGQFLTITEVTCSTLLSKPLAYGYISISDGTAQTQRRIKSLAMDATQSPAGWVSWIDHLEYKVAGGPPRVVTIFISADSSPASFGVLRCSITGRLSTQ